MLDVLLVDDEPTLRLSVGDALEDAGHLVTRAADGRAGLDRARERVFDVVVSDIRMPGMDGISLFRAIKELSPETSVILMTAYGAVEDAVAALREGAYDYLTKPFDVDELLVRVGRISERQALRRELTQARGELAKSDGARELIGRSPAMNRLVDRTDTLAPSDAPVLIQGESGTGKELVARRLHALSNRTGAPFVAVHCAAFPETLIEAELFGHERGAFTGAVRRRDGRFVVASSGTLFLDEVAEIPLPAQAKLLRALQEGVIERLGASEPVKVDVRILSATHRDLKQCVREGTFREDLYYRLKVLDVRVPPLRERKADLPLLVEHFLRGFDPDSPGLTPRAWAALKGYNFPGNVRELEHAVHHGAVLARGEEIGLAHLPEDIVGEDPHETAMDGEIAPLSVAVKAFEIDYLRRALQHTGGKKARAAELLGISRKSLWEKLRDQPDEATD